MSPKNVVIIPKSPRQREIEFQNRSIKTRETGSTIDSQEDDEEKVGDTFQRTIGEEYNTVKSVTDPQVSYVPMLLQTRSANDGKSGYLGNIIGFISIILVIVFGFIGGYFFFDSKIDDRFFRIEDNIESFKINIEEKIENFKKDIEEKVDNLFTVISVSKSINHNDKIPSETDKDSTGITHKWLNHTYAIFDQLA